ncbi:MAG: MMPL family transporter, partial [Vicinamibacteria bacterium]
VVLVGALPILLATMLTLAAHQVWGVELAAAAAGSSAMLFGLGDDGLVLLFVAYRAALARGLTPIEAVSTLGGTGVSILLGAVTTTATFLGLWFMSFPSLQQLGVIVGVGILLAALLTLTLLVAGLPGPAWAAEARDLALPGLARFVGTHRRRILIASALLTLPLAAGLARLEVNPTLERLRPRGEGFAVEDELTRRFGLPQDLLLVVAEGPALAPLLDAHAQVMQALAGVSDLRLSSAATLVPEADTQAARAARLAQAAADAPAAIAAVNEAADDLGFVADTFAPFAARLPVLLDGDARLTPEGYRQHGLGDVLGRFVADGPRGHIVVTYAEPGTPAARRALEAAVAAVPGLELTGLPVVNASLAERFPRELAAGLGIGALVVLLLIWMEFRAVVPTLYALVPTALGLVWGLGVLGWAGVVLDLFSVFAVLMFLGIGVDYGIHLVHPTVRATDPQAPSRAIALVGPAMLLAGLTTLVGFGTLIRSDYVPLYSLGMASVATIGMSLVAALFTLPALLLAREEQIRAWVAGDGKDQKPLSVVKIEELLARQG